MKVAPSKRKAPSLVPGYERIPGSARHYRVVATGEELSRRQFRQRVQGYTYERTEKGRVRSRARRSYIDSWIRHLRTRFDEFASASKTAILREMRRLGFKFPHHGGKRKPSPAERAGQEAFLGFIGRSTTAYRQVYPTLLEEPD
jgi:hypothetical protein